MGKRQLTAIEIAEARLVFRDSLDYDKVRLHEGVAWSNWVARIGAWLSRTPPPPQNAVTLGNRIYLPVEIRTTLSPTDDAFIRDMGWLIHELTHSWQYQHDGAIYFFQALWVQLKLGPDSYDYGGQQGLELAAQAGKNLSDFNREQQGEIARDYYHGRKKGQDVTAWEPFVLEFSSQG